MEERNRGREEEIEIGERGREEENGNLCSTSLLIRR